MFFFLLGGSNGALVWSPRIREVLIKKLEKVYKGTERGDPLRVTVTLRLADLSAERAKNVTLTELNADCVECVTGDKDRKQAISYYKEVVPFLEQPSQKIKVFSHMGEIYDFLGQLDDSVKSYKSALPVS